MVAEHPIGLGRGILFQKRTPSFQKEFSFEDKEIAKKTKDIDANLLAVLPKGKKELQDVWKELEVTHSQCCYRIAAN